MTSYRDQRTRPSVAQEIFGKEYVPYIADIILLKYGNSYSSYKTDLNTWRATVAYNPAVEDMIVLKTKLFIVMLDHYSKENAQNPQFLQSFIKMVVDYLSKYTVKNPRFPGRTRKEAKVELMQILWDDFNHIQALLARQARQRAARKLQNTYYKKSKVTDGQNAKKAYDRITAMQRCIVSGHNPKQK